MASPLGLSFGTDSNDKRIPQYLVLDNKAVKSLFNDSQLSPYPTVKNSSSGSVEKIKTAFDIHNDDINDISIGSIIEYCSDPSRTAMKLNYAQFAYLKNLGVYPNNRLIIARRFSGGVANDLNEVKGGTPMSTLISWFGEEEEPLSIKFNEEWDQAEGGFEDVLNDIGEDVLMGDNAGGKLGTGAKNAFGIIPLPGLMEGVQLEMLNILGLAGGNQGAGMSPFGNPNLIRDAQVRKVLKKATAGSGLSCDFEIKMSIEYEQKFINGVDPTVVYLDIIQNAITFGTSESVFQYSSAYGAGANDIIQKLISGDINGIIQAITQMITALIEAIKTAIGKIVEQLKKAIDEKETKKEESPADKANAEKGLIDEAAAGLLGNLLKISVGTVISKYKVRLIGIVNALTGQASTPWHVTIGNPKKPIFSSGDMLCKGVTITLGKVLAFNDLPSSIKIDVTFVNARGMGAQEIFNRFNSGRGRSYTRINKSFVEVSDYLIDEVVKIETEKQNKDKKSETQTEPAKVEQQKSAPGTTEIDKDKNQGKKVEPTPPVKDDYPITGTGKTAVEWGPEQSLVPQENTSKTVEQAAIEKSLIDQADLRGIGVTGSNQSTGDPGQKNLVPASGGATGSAAGPSTPGVTQSTDAIKTAAAQGNTASAPQPDNVPAESQPKPTKEPEPTQPTQATQSTATQSTPPTNPTVVPETEPPVNFEIIGVVGEDGDPLVVVKNNGKVIKTQSYVKINYTVEKAVEHMKFGAFNFGISGDDGRYYKQGEVPR